MQTSATIMITTNNINRLFCNILATVVILSLMVSCDTQGRHKRKPACQAFWIHERKPARGGHEHELCASSVC